MSSLRSRNGGIFSGRTFKPVIQILAKLALLQRRAQIDVGGGDHAHIHVPDLVAAQPLEFAILQDAQQLHLDGREARRRSRP